MDLLTNGVGTMSFSKALSQPKAQPQPQQPKPSAPVAQQQPQQAAAPRSGVPAQAPAQGVDFDFASANAKFVKEGAPSSAPPTTGEEVVIPEASPGSFYDKKKSFFDDISSEIKERADPTTQQQGAIEGGARGGRGRGRGRGGWDRGVERQRNLCAFSTFLFCCATAR